MENRHGFGNSVELDLDEALAKVSAEYRANARNRLVSTQSFKEKT